MKKLQLIILIYFVFFTAFFFLLKERELFLKSLIPLNF